MPNIDAYFFLFNVNDNGRFMLIESIQNLCIYSIINRFKTYIFNNFMISIMHMISVL